MTVAPALTPVTLQTLPENVTRATSVSAVVQRTAPPRVSPVIVATICVVAPAPSDGMFVGLTVIEIGGAEVTVTCDCANLVASTRERTVMIAVPGETPRTR